MRRILLVLSVAVLMAAIVVVLAVPAWADAPDHPGNCRFEQGKTYCTEREYIGTVTEEVGEVEYEVECAGPGEPYDVAWVLEETYWDYNVYQVTETTYAGKSEHVLDRNTRTEREFVGEFILTTGGCYG